MFSKSSCKLQLSLMNKFYPQLAYPDEIKKFLYGGYAKDAYQNISDHLFNLYGAL